MMTFPMQTLPDLMGILSNEFQSLDLSEEDFIHPTAAKWQEVFTILLTLLTGRNLNDLKSQMNREVSSSELPEFHRAGLELASLARLLNRVLIPAGIDHFSTKDIIGANKKRLLRVMSAIVNYTRYQTERQADFEECSRILQKRCDDYNTLLTQRDSIIQKLNDKKKAMAEQDEKVAIIRERKDQMLRGMAGKQKYVDRINTDVRELTVKAQAVVTDQVQYKESVASLMRESERLESKILQSPERAVREKAIMEAKIVQFSLTSDDKLSRLGEVSRAAHLLRSDECRQACKLLDCISEPAAQMRQLVMEINHVKDEQQQLSFQVVDLSAKIQSARGTVAARQEKFDKQKLQQQLKDDGLKQQLHELKVVHNRMSENEDMLCKMEKELKVLVERTSDQREAFRTRMDVLQNSEASLLSDVEKYNSMFVNFFQADE